MREKDICDKCNEEIEGKWDSQVQLCLQTGELDRAGAHQFLIYDKHIRCSPSRAQRIIHDKFPRVYEDRPQFDFRKDECGLTKLDKAKYEQLYTNAWVELQRKFNPEWRETK